MTAPRAPVLMAGTAPGGKGGVASVVTVLQQQGFFDRHQVRYITTHVDQSGRAKLAVFGRAAWQLLTACGGRPLVHVHAASRASFYRKSLLLAIARWRGCATIFHLHGAEFQQFAQHESGPLLRWWIRHTLERSSAVIALSDTWAAFLRDYAPRATVTVVPNSVPLPALDGPAEQPGRILFLGRAERRKGIFDLLEAAALLAPEFPGLQLRIGGDGDLEAVRRRVAELGLEAQVQVLGWIGAAQRADELARASVFTLPSYDEGLPMAMLEAMAWQKALVVSPVGGIPQAVQDRHNGLLVAPGNPAALAAALRELLLDQPLRHQLAQAARATIAQRFASDVVLEQLSALYRGLGK